MSRAGPHGAAGELISLAAPSCVSKHTGPVSFRTGDGLTRTWLLAFFFVTVILGVSLRWDLATTALTRVGFDFAHVRHAHSHAGFYGLLTLAWWLVARRDVRTTRLFVSAYVASVALATVFFALGGYTPITIVLSTVVAGFWVVSAWRARHARGWFALVPVGIILGMCLIVPIAVTARRDLLLSRDLAHVFLAIMTLVAFVPAALGSLRVPRISPFAWVLSTVCGSTYLVFAERLPFPLGWFASLTGLALIIAISRRPEPLPRHLHVVWMALGAGLVVMGLVPPLQTEANRLAALHFTLLGPLALSALEVLAVERRRARPKVFAVCLTAAALLIGAMVSAPIIGQASASYAAAASGSAFLLATVALFWPPRSVLAR